MRNIHHLQNRSTSTRRKGQTIRTRMRKSLLTTHLRGKEERCLHQVIRTEDRRVAHLASRQMGVSIKHIPPDQGKAGADTTIALRRNGAKAQLLQVQLEKEDIGLDHLQGNGQRVVPNTTDILEGLHHLVAGSCHIAHNAAGNLRRLVLQDVSAREE